MDVDQITEKTIGAAFKVSNVLGVGFVESVYEKSMLIELAKAGLSAQSQVPIKVTYDSQGVGEFIADILVEGCLIIELKAVSTLSSIHEVQLVNYLKATGINDGLLINFGTAKLQIKRKYRQLSDTHHDATKREKSPE